MRRRIRVPVVISFVLLSALFYLFGTPRARAQPPAAPPPKPSLNCAQCHGPGKTLPYLGGEYVHKDAHEAYGLGHHARAVRNGHKAAACLDCHATGGDMTQMLPASDPKSTVNRANIAITCGKCHGDPAVMQASGIDKRLLTAYRSSAHAHAWARGNQSAAVCTDCHSSHDVRPASDPASPIFKFNIAETCGACHRAEAADFRQSVHGTSIARGNSQSATCTDCHGIHNITAPAEAGTTLRTNTCARCHEGVRLTQEFGVAAGRVSSYRESYHGLASKLGSDVVADCASCHGVHNILPSSDERSMIHQANLVQTCGQCHPGAGENFARGRVHLDVPASQDIGSTGTRWVRWVYLGLILVTIGGMAAHNGLVWRRKAAAKLRRERRTVERLTVNQRAQHWLLLTSFITLVVSGFALVYPDSWITYLTGSSEWARRLTHRVAAVVMIAVGLYHMAYLALAREGRSWVRDMRPRWKDLTDLAQNMRHYLGGRAPRPKIARFGYAEKAEYWAVVWGTLIMGLTGLMIWFKLGWFGFLPRWTIDIATAIHFYEAVLASLAIVVWHFYHVILDPDVYPVNWAFVDGRVSEEAYREEHALDYERLAGGDGASEQEGEGEAAPGADASGGDAAPSAAGAD
jgi:formate dehydrogenase gamma subunit